MDHSKKIPPEDPDSVAKRDRVERQSKTGARARARVHRNPDDRHAPIGVTARSQAFMLAGQKRPYGVNVVMPNGKKYGHRFTDRQWAALALVYGGFSGPRSVAYVARRLGMETKQLQQDLDGAVAICFHIVAEYEPALRKWNRIKAGNPFNEELTKQEKQWLDRGRRTDRKKKGRAEVLGQGGSEVRRRNPELAAGDLDGLGT